MSYIEMSPSARQEALQDLGRALQQTLAELIDLGLVARQLHWTVVGPTFGSLHAQLDELADHAHALADEVAERQAGLGLVPDGRSAAVSGQSGFEPPAAAPTPDGEVLALIGERLAEMAARLSVRLQLAADVDPVSEDILRGVLAGVEKQRWLVLAQLPQAASGPARRSS